MAAPRFWAGGGASPTTPPRPSPRPRGRRRGRTGRWRSRGGPAARGRPRPGGRRSRPRGRGSAGGRRPALLVAVHRDGPERAVGPEAESPGAVAGGRLEDPELGKAVFRGAGP